MLRFTLLLGFCAVAFAKKSVIAEKGVSIMLQAVGSARTAGTVRMCTCQEMQRCIAQDMNTMNTCSQQCYGVFSSVTRTPYALRGCLDQGTANQVTSCVTSGLFSCNGRGYTRRYSYQRFYSTVLLQLQSRKNELTGTSALRMIQPVASAGLDFGACSLNCFNRYNPDRCFDSLGCQPQVNEQMVRPLAKKCFKQIERAAASKCYCMLNAGVSSLRNFCGLASSLMRG
ncbi:unnamed protein product, partial [Mesorhabditis belari]|uniref:Uncharacterized protein n=1 Tax=Mesorhabditis belari TaxID=2138241 RepID=A0AAF3EXX1_9BILA